MWVPQKTKCDFLKNPKNHIYFTKRQKNHSITEQKKVQKYRIVILNHYSKTI